MFEYQRIVQYYETDRMNITHHSNYVRWMEEARTYHLAQIGIPYRQFEADGIISPVVAVNVEYKSPSTYEDKIGIEISLTQYTGVSFEYTYTIKNLTTGKIAAQCTSRHCFAKNGRPYSLEHYNEHFHAVMQAALGK